MPYIISDIYNVDEIIYLSGNLYAKNQLIADLIVKVKKDKLSCGYAWTEFDPLIDDFELDGIEKEGQTSTGDVIKRVSSFSTRLPQLITDIIIDKIYMEMGIDQKILFWRSDPDNELDVSRIHRRTKEDIQYLTEEAYLEAPTRRRHAIRKMLENDDAGRIDLDIRVPTVMMLIAWINVIKRRNFKIDHHIDSYELCARFGKTIFALCLFSISTRELLVFGSYYQSAFSSIINEVNLFHQFSNLRVVDGRLSNAEKLAIEYIKQGYKVVVLTGLHSKKNWEETYKWINQYNKSKKICIFDEVDFGIPTNKVSTKVKYLIDKSYTILMSGTNIDKTQVNFKITDIQAFTYDEMLETKDYIRTNKKYAFDQFDQLISLINQLNGIII